ERAANGLQQLGYQTHTAIAPTPQGARLLSITGNGQQALDGPALLSLLRRLPITVLQQPDDIIHKLRGIGLRTVGDCLRLPRDGVGKRFGPDLLHYIDRLLGRIDDPQVPFVSPPHFSSQIFLTTETSDIEALLFAAKRLLDELVGFLRARGSGVQLLRLHILHHHRAATALHIGLLQASRDAAHLLKLLRERLDRHTLSAPAEGIALHSDAFVPLTHEPDDLFVSSHAGTESWPALLERLQVRVGSDAVKGLRPVADHRPDRAWDYCAPGTSGGETSDAPRPMWLLETPLRLVMRDGVPYMEGKLRLVRGPERIEAGWWDNADVARDYFVAENDHAVRLWVFRELTNPQRWFLHGIFG
ncbi:MAG: DNA polymerase Y family protein, partial [Pseudomonadota bacterium]